MKERIKKHLDFITRETEQNFIFDNFFKAADKLKNLSNSEEYSLISVPGRTEIIGNHTDHNGGKVLAASINKKTFAVCSKNNINLIKIVSEGFEDIIVDCNDIDYDSKEEGSSRSLIKGILNKYKSRGFNIGGFTAVLFSNIPIGAGLSSSASFEILICSILNHFYNDGKIGISDLAKISKFAENNFFGKPSGLMDQLSCAVGGIIKMDFKDENNPNFKEVNFNFSDIGYSIVLIDTGGSHANLTPLYASIPEDMKRIANFFNKDRLCELEESQIKGNSGELASKISYRAVLRAIHFFEENNRVSKLEKFMNEKDIKNILNTINDSGNSSYKYLQNILMENPKEQRLAFAIKAVEDFFVNENDFAVRVHGGGFDGTIQVFLKKEKQEDLIKYIDKYFSNFTAIPIEISSEGIIVS